MGWGWGKVCRQAGRGNGQLGGGGGAGKKAAMGGGVGKTVVSTVFQNKTSSSTGASEGACFLYSHWEDMQARLGKSAAQCASS